ncbi:Hypothetical_protein [Hexamita inflata]|uniref:Hypothetical_protein n=1 Tax=Hexamita inflata TaxID=28002 RepID=A0AA86RAB7_9EUKA|nr:Hypothetical protein HINF_LOCUS61370 [Hexamita inflata]
MLCVLQYHYRLTKSTSTRFRARFYLQLMAHCRNQDSVPSKLKEYRNKNNPRLLRGLRTAGLINYFHSRCRRHSRKTSQRPWPTSSRAPPEQAPGGCPRTQEGQRTPCTTSGPRGRDLALGSSRTTPTNWELINKQHLQQFQRAPAEEQIPGDRRRLRLPPQRQEAQEAGARQEKKQLCGRAHGPEGRRGLQGAQEPSGRLVRSELTLPDPISFKFDKFRSLVHLSLNQFRAALECIFNIQQLTASGSRSFAPLFCSESLSSTNTSVTPDSQRFDSDRSSCAQIPPFGIPHSKAFGRSLAVFSAQIEYTPEQLEMSQNGGEGVLQRGKPELWIRRATCQHLSANTRHCTVQRTSWSTAAASMPEPSEI